MNATAFAVLLRDHMKAAVTDVAARRMVVDSLDSGMVVVRDIGTGDVYDEPYARLAGTALAPDDECLVLEIPGIGENAGTTRVVLGRLQRSAPDVIEFEAPISGQIQIAGGDAEGGEVASSSSTSTWVTALTVPWTDLPNGTYRVVTDGSLLAAHSATGNVDLRVSAGASPGGGVSLQVETTVPARTRIAVASVFSSLNVSGGSGVTLTLQYKPSSAGTAYVRNPVLRAWAVQA